jgi:hypothetical protein
MKKPLVIPIRAEGSFQEPTLDEILADPITRAVMRADGVDRQKLDTMFHRVAEGLKNVRRDRFTDMPAAGLMLPWRAAAAGCWPTCS